jgi:diaminopimelate epimerase
LIRFTKAHACGNDFLIVTKEAAAGRDWPELTRRLCARNTGVGADGVEFFQWTGPKSGSLRLHNADGSIAEISGNGTRCVAAWMALERGLQAGDDVEITTDAGLRVCHLNAIENGGKFTVEVTAGMGIPAFEQHSVRLANEMWAAGVTVSTGNPHFVILVDNAEFTVGRKTWREIGAEIGVHSDFRSRLTSSSSALSAPRRLRFASSSAAWGRPALPAPAVRPAPQRPSAYTAVTRRSLSSLPAARKKSSGMARARSCG